MSEDRPSIQAVFEHYDGRMARWKSYGWSACYCILPGHDDRTASAQINDETGRFRCLACSVSYDVYGLVMAVENLGFKDAKRRAAELAGGDSDVRATAPGLSGRGVASHKGSRPGRRAYVPPWARGTA